MAETPRGTLFLVVGPSGAGKDTLLDAARAALAPGAAFLFPVREITRRDDAGGEHHQAITAEAFAAKRAAGGYALCWEAHGHCYGVDAGIDAALGAGRHVVSNVSRAVINDARRRYHPLQILLVTARPATLARRIAARGRETAAEAEARLLRSVDYPPQGLDVHVIDNDGTIDAAVIAFLAALTSAGERH